MTTEELIRALVMDARDRGPHNRAPSDQIEKEQPVQRQVILDLEVGSSETSFPRAAIKGANTPVRSATAADG